MTPLIPGDANSTANGITNKGQVSGRPALPMAQRHGFVWRTRTDNLNGAAQTDTRHITVATDINDAGVITGRAVEPYGKVAIVATPSLTSAVCQPRHGADRKPMSHWYALSVRM